MVVSFKPLQIPQGISFGNTKLTPLNFLKEQKTKSEKKTLVLKKIEGFNHQENEISQQAKKSKHEQERMLEPLQIIQNKHEEIKYQQEFSRVKIERNIEEAKKIEEKLCDIQNIASSVTEKVMDAQEKNEEIKNEQKNLTSEIQKVELKQEIIQVNNAKNLENEKIISENLSQAALIEGLIQEKAISIQEKYTIIQEQVKEIEEKKEVSHKNIEVLSAKEIVNKNSAPVHFNNDNELIHNEINQKNQKNCFLLFKIINFASYILGVIGSGWIKMKSLILLRQYHLPLVSQLISHSTTRITIEFLACAKMKSSKISFFCAVVESSFILYLYKQKLRKF